MNIRVISSAQVKALLPITECTELMARALTTLARGDAVQPLRSATWLPDRSGLLGVMPGWLGSPPAFGLKVVTVMPGNHGGEYDSHQGTVTLFDPTTGAPVAIVDAGAITAIRTAAVSAVATRWLARAEASQLALLGSGVQAATHLQALLGVRPIEKVTVWSPTAGRAQRFAAEQSALHAVQVEAAASAQEAVQDADIICTVTAATEPILQGAWLKPGTHVNAVGACRSQARELDTKAVQRARVFVDRMESALHEAGDLLIPMGEGAIGELHIVGELGDVLMENVPGRRSAEEITLFESLGLAIEDLAAAHHVWREAERGDVGESVDLGELKFLPEERPGRPSGSSHPQEEQGFASA